jgi:hypothetical protein
MNQTNSQLSLSALLPGQNDEEAPLPKEERRCHGLEWPKRANGEAVSLHGLPSAALAPAGHVPPKGLLQVLLPDLRFDSFPLPGILDFFGLLIGFQKLVLTHRRTLHVLLSQHLARPDGDHAFEVVHNHPFLVQRAAPDLIPGGRILGLDLFDVGDDFLLNSLLDMSIRPTIETHDLFLNLGIERRIRAPIKL